MPNSMVNASATAHPSGLPTPPLSNGYKPRPFTQLGVQTCQFRDVYMGATGNVRMFTCNSHHYLDGLYDETVSIIDYNQDGIIDAAMREVEYRAPLPVKTQIKQRHTYIMNSLFKHKASSFGHDGFASFIHAGLPEDSHEAQRLNQHFTIAATNLLSDFARCLKMGCQKYWVNMDERNTCRTQTGSPVSIDFITRDGVSALCTPKTVFLTSATIMSNNLSWNHVRFHYDYLGNNVILFLGNLLKETISQAATLPLCNNDRELYERRFYGK